MQMRYRSRTDIVYEILEAAKDRSITKSKIMYKAFLSYEQLCEYLKIMLERGMLLYDEKTQLYKATKKCFEFTRLYKQMSQFETPLLQK